MALETAASFLEALETSRLLSPEQMAVSRQMAADAPTARDLARALVRHNLLTRWQAGQLLAGRTEFHWGKYRLVDFLGRGGMGSVFLAWHTMMNRPVALKAIARDLVKDPAALERFLVEARAAAALDHPNIVHAYDVATEGDRYYLVMEYVEGRDLQRIVEQEGPLEFSRAAEYIRQAAEGLAHAHAKQMVHCDIKPANLFVNQQGVVKILDMGMARAIGRKPTVASTEAEPRSDPGLLGTVDYMAPELGLEHAKPDPRTDIYSLGCTFYFLLTGRPPFPEGTLAERIAKHQSAEPADLAELRPDCPAELIRICRTMMAKDPNDRFQSAEEISRALSSWRPAGGTVLRAVPLEEEELEAAPTWPVAKPVSAKQSWATRWIGLARGWLNALAADRRRMWIAAGASGALLGLLTIGAIWWAVAAAKARRQQLAEAKPSASKAAQASNRDEQDAFKGLKLAFEQPDESVAAKAEVSAGKPGPPPPPGAGLQPPPPAGSPSAVGVGPPPPRPGPEALGQVSKAVPGPSEPKPVESPPAKPKDQAKDQSAPKPAASTEAKPPSDQPAQKAPEENKKAPPAAAEKKPAVPPDPLKDFPKVLALPPLPEPGAGEFSPGPQLLGAIAAPLATPCTVNLLGRESVLPGKREFGWESRPGTDQKDVWVVTLEPLGKEAEKLEVAQFVRDAEGLKFQWAEQAAKANGEYLRNCVLEISLGGTTRCVPLRQPVQWEPIVFDLQKTALIVKLPLEFPPQEGMLRFEITKVEGRDEKQEKPVIQPSGPVPLGPKNALRLVFPRKDRQGRQVEGIQFQIMAALRGKALEVRVTNPPPAEFKRIVQLVAAQRIGLEEEARRLQQQFAHAKEPPEKADIARKLEPIEAPLWFDEFYQQMHRKGRLHFRLLCEIQQQRFELGRTQVPE